MIHGLHTIAATHFPPLGPTVAGVIFAMLVMLGWQRLNETVPPGARRRTRQVSMLVMLAIDGLIVLGVAWIDHSTHPTAYVFTWAAALLMLLALIGTALIDAWITLRAASDARHDLMIREIIASRKDDGDDASEDAGDDDARHEDTAR